MQHCVRLHAVLLREAGASRGHSNGRPATRRGNLILYDRIVSRSGLPAKCSHQAKQGLACNRGMGKGSRRCRPGTSFLQVIRVVLTYHHQAILLDPSSPWGYEMKHAALQKGGDYDNAAIALEMMLSKMKPNLDIQRKLYPCSHDQCTYRHVLTVHGDKNISSSSTRAMIKNVV